MADLEGWEWKSAWNREWFSCTSDEPIGDLFQDVSGAVTEAHWYARRARVQKELRNTLAIRFRREKPIADRASTQEPFVWQRDHLLLEEFEPLWTPVMSP